MHTYGTLQKKCSWTSVDTVKVSPVNSKKIKARGGESGCCGLGEGNAKPEGQQRNREWRELGHCLSTYLFSSTISDRPLVTLAKKQWSSSSVVLLLWSAVCLSDWRPPTPSNHSHTKAALPNQFLLPDPAKRQTTAPSRLRKPSQLRKMSRIPRMITRRDTSPSLGGLSLPWSFHQSPSSQAITYTKDVRNHSLYSAKQPR